MRVFHSQNTQFLCHMVINYLNPTNIHSYFTNKEIYSKVHHTTQTQKHPLERRQVRQRSINTKNQLTYNSHIYKVFSQILIP